MSLDLDYYYGNEAEQYSFYRIPKALFTDGRFRGVSVEARVLYGLLLDRMSLSVRNGWLDGEGRVYIIFTVADVMETLACAEQKANKLLNELDTAKGVGLIERKRRGLGKPNVIYVKNFIAKPQMPPGKGSLPDPPLLPGNGNPSDFPAVPGQADSSGRAAPSGALPQPEPTARTAPMAPQEPADTLTGCPRTQKPQPQESQIQNCENHKSGIVKTTNQELRFSQTNNTDLNDTEMSETNPSIPGYRGRGGRTVRGGWMGWDRRNCFMPIAH